MVEDLIWVSFQAVKLEGNLKLLLKWLKPFDMMEVHCNADHLHLPDVIWIHPVMNISIFKPFISTLSSDPPYAIKAQVVCNDKFKIDRIIDHQWKGCQWPVFV